MGASEVIFDGLHIFLVDIFHSRRDIRLEIEVLFMIVSANNRNSFSNSSGTRSLFHMKLRCDYSYWKTERNGVLHGISLFEERQKSSCNSCSIIYPFFLYITVSGWIVCTVLTSNQILFLQTIYIEEGCHSITHYFSWWSSFIDTQYIVVFSLILLWEGVGGE